jgi:uncharacterized protein YxeA
MHYKITTTTTTTTTTIIIIIIIIIIIQLFIYMLIQQLKANYRVWHEKVKKQKKTEKTSQSK